MLTRSDKLALMAAILQSGWSGSGGREESLAVDEAEALLREVESREPQPEPTYDKNTPINFSVVNKAAIRSAALDEAIAVCDKYRDDMDYVVANSIKREIEALKSQPRKDEEHG